MIAAIHSWLMSLGALAQVGIAFTGVVAIFLAQSEREPRRRWAPVFGLCGQVCWFYSSYTAHQWGIFLLAFFYTFAWCKGVWSFWVLPALKRQRLRRQLLGTQPL